MLSSYAPYHVSATLSSVFQYSSYFIIVYFILFIPAHHYIAGIVCVSMLKRNELKNELGGQHQPVWKLNNGFKRITHP